MKNTRLATVAALGLTALVSACGDSTTPAPPALGRQIDRMGRAGVNTALTDPFNLNKSASDAVKDQYNAAAQSQWASYAPRIAGNLAILDSLDTVCGNQILAGATASAGRYNTLATVLADDEIYVNTDSGTCTQYLAVEANAIGIRNGDCGGRTPLYNSIDTTYSVLAAGALSGVSNGITRDADASVANTSQFPFFGNPN